MPRHRDVKLQKRSGRVGHLWSRDVSTSLGQLLKLSIVFDVNRGSVSMVLGEIASKRYIPISGMKGYIFHAASVDGLRRITGTGAAETDVKEEEEETRSRALVRARVPERT